MTIDSEVEYDFWDHTVSQRFFHYTRHGMPWWKIIDLAGIHGGDENCNRTIGFKWGRGEWFICLNIPLRQKPCRKCLIEAYDHVASGGHTAI